jgi:hypothetical protein
MEPLRAWTLKLFGGVARSRHCPRPLEDSATHGPSKALGPTELAAEEETEGAVEEALEEAEGCTSSAASATGMAIGPSWNHVAVPKLEAAAGDTPSSSGELRTLDAGWGK